MPSFRDIPYSMQYNEASKRFVALEDLHHSSMGVIPCVPISRPSLYPFLQFNDSLFECQRLMASNPSKSFWIILLDQNFFDWDRQVLPAYMVLQKIIVFCFCVKNYFRLRTQPNPERPRIDEICLHDEVEKSLTWQGIAYIHVIKDSFKNSRSIYNQCCDDANAMIIQLGMGYDSLIEKLDEQISIEEEGRDGITED